MGDVEVKVTYKYVDNPSVENPFTVDMEVHVESGAGKIFMGSACLCKGVHRVYWTLKGDPSELSNFKLTSNTPALVILHGLPTKDPVTGKWTALIENTGVKEVNGLSYTFDCNPPVNFSHDPTIAVTNDPPPGGILL